MVGGGGEKEKKSNNVSKKGRRRGKKEIKNKKKKSPLSVIPGISPWRSDWFPEQLKNGYFDNQSLELYKLLGDRTGSIKSSACWGCVLMWRRLRK